MPAPQEMIMANLTKTLFTAFQIRVPTDWQNPSEEVAQKQYRDAFKETERNVPPAATPFMLALPSSMNKYHVDAQKSHIDIFGKFIDGTIKGIVQAWTLWSSTAVMTGAIVAGPTVSGGQVVAAPWLPTMLAVMPKETPQLLKYSQVVANVISTAWTQFTTAFKIPGLPLFPAFAAFPGPVAPPMPNVPVPVMAIASAGLNLLKKDLLKQQMISQLAMPTAPFHKELFDAICNAFEQLATAWCGMTMLKNLMGTGPIPTFAPPYVPVGPVVGGVANMIPGGFA
jgi:hypothetical protein